MTVRRNTGMVFFTASVLQLRDATIEALFEEVSSMRSIPRLYNEGQLRLRESLETAVGRVGMCCETVAGQ
jgi:hypothetical protein